MPDTTEDEEKRALHTLTAFWIPIKAFEGKKGIIYESRRGRRIFIKYVNRPRHFMRKHQSWAIDEDILSELQAMKVEQIYLYVKGEGLYVTTMEAFEERSLVDEYGHGEQSFLHESFWELVRRE